MASTTQNTAKSNTNRNSGKGKGKNRSKQAQEASISQYHLDLAAEYLQLTLYKDALRCANRALELDPKLLLARIRRGIARKNLGLLDAALADFDTVLSIDSSFTKARESREEILLAKQKGREECVKTPTAPTQNRNEVTTRPPEDTTNHHDDDNNDDDDENDRNDTTKDDESTSGGSDRDFDSDSDDEDADIMVNSETPCSSFEREKSSDIIDYTTPHYDASPASPTRSSDANKAENELDHIGNNKTACRFYNHNGCNRSTACAFSHAPDSKSVRDEHGKNVCLYFLIDKCKWDNQSCIYSHSKTFLSASVSPISASPDTSTVIPPSFTLSASFAPLSSSAPTTRPPDGDPQGWWNDPEASARVRELVLRRDETARLAHEARVASFDARGKNKRSKKGPRNSKMTATTATANPAAPVLPRHLDTLFSSLRTRYYNGSDFDDSEYSFDTDIEEESQMEQRYLNGGFTDDEVMELLCQGVKPWDDDADMVLAALSGDYW
ncbi:hypothetical protein K435DRAFT_972366 [Dendrothele bispora CBS 962.96]|uniref:C3H1-type domain-containing protein n=1 Tax=Dendrothele bispora (strain CBS 962.96) TaxID=1314807 RepID=A0A4S8KZ98_DENBC|nr:hypothetical protein K435DRAFT_972366 [Dendrothele bispora CBS 962.96]